MRAIALIFLSTWLIAGFAAGAADPAAASGYYLEERITTVMDGQPVGPPELIQTWILGDDLMRKDTHQGTRSILFQIAKKTIWVVDHQNRNYVEINADKFQQLAAMGVTMMSTPEQSGDPLTGQVSMERTGRKKKIGDWECYEIRWRDAGQAQDKSRQWISDETGFDSKVYAKIFELTFGGAVPEKYSSVLKNLRELNGFPVRTEKSLNLGDKSITRSQTLVKLEKQSLTPAHFQLPEGYQKIDLFDTPKP